MSARFIRTAACLWLAALAGRAEAQTTLWTTAGSGAFASASNWGSGEPNATTSASIVNGTVGTPSTATLGPSQSASAFDLTLGAYDTLDVAQGGTLSVYGGTIANAGVLTVSGGYGYNTVLSLDANVTLSGAGVMALSYGDHNGTAILEEGGGSYTLTNAGGTVEGDGVIGNGGLALINGAGGTIDADVSGQVLTLNGTGGITNAGTLEATGGGVLQVLAGVANAGGVITANGGTVEIGTTVTGGTLSTSAGGVLETQGTATLSGVAIPLGSTYTAALDTTTFLVGTILNSGSLQANAGQGNTTYLDLPASVTLQGGGSLTLDSGDTNGLVYVQPYAGSFTLTNVDNLVQGYGVIGNGGLSLVNESAGTVDADVSGRVLALNGSGGITNTGTLEASAGGVLEVSTAVANTGGLVTANGGTVEIGTTVTGGTLTTANGGVLETLGTAVLSGVAVPLGTTFTGPLGTTTSLEGTIANAGSLVFYGGQGNNTYLDLLTPVTLQGGGTLTLSSGDTNGIVTLQSPGASRTLTNVDNLIQGYGMIGNGALALSNGALGVVDADTASRTLTLNGSGGIVNQGTLEATNGGTLQVSTPVDNLGASIVAATGTVGLSSSVAGGTLSGGNLQTVGSATLDGSSQGALTLASGSTYTSPLDSTTTLLGTVENLGSLVVDGGNGNTTTLVIGSGVKLQGGGTVTFNNGDNNGRPYVQQGSASLTLTNVDNLIQGAATIGNGGLAFVNESAGVVDANLASQTLVLNGTGNIVNTGLLEATNSGTLQVTNTVANAGGTIAANGGIVIVDGAGTIQGGTLVSENGGTLGTDGTAVLDGRAAPVVVPAGTTWTGALNTTTGLLGSIQNSGNLQVNGGNGNNTSLLVESAVTLGGGGSVTLSSGNLNGFAYVRPSGGSFTLTNADNLIQGYGFIGSGALTFVNQASGVVSANVSGKTLTLNGTGGVTNLGTLEAVGGGTLQLSTGVANAGGVLSASGGTIDVSSTVEGGTLTGAGFATNGSAVLDGLDLGTLLLSTGTTYSAGLGTTTVLGGTIENEGLFEVYGGYGNNTLVLVESAVTLDGGGTVTLNNGDNNGRPLVEQSGGSFTLTNVDNLIQGAGTLGSGGLAFVNESAGVVDADISGQTLLLNGSGNVVNTGLLEATASGRLQISSTVANAGGTVSANGGTVIVDGGGVIQGGTLSSSNGGAIETDNSATLDGTASALTLAPSTAWTSGLGTTTLLEGTIVNQGNLQVYAGFGNNTFVALAGNVTLEGGGSVSLSSGDLNGEAYLEESGGAYTLTNVNGLIQGYGVIGNGGISLVNEAAGTVLANASGETLTVNTSGTVSNLGTFEAQGGTLAVASAVTNFSGGTLTGGTWEAAGGGTILFQAGPNPVSTNAATVILSGTGSEIETRSGSGGSYQALEATLATNSGTLEVLGGRGFAAAGPLDNTGTIELGGGVLSAPSMALGPASVLSGTGTVSVAPGVAFSGGASVAPGLPLSGSRIGTLAFAGPVTFGGGGAYTLAIMNAPSAVAGTDNSLVTVSGTLTIASNGASPFAIDLESVNPQGGALGLANFNPAVASTWTIASAGSLSGFGLGDFTVNTSLFQNPLDGGSFTVDASGSTLTLNFVPVPEPGVAELLLLGLVTLASGRGLRRRSALS